MSDIGPITSAASTPAINADVAEKALRNKQGDVAQIAKPAIDIKTDEKAVVKMAAEVETVVNAVSETSLSFSVDKDLSRMVVAVRAVGSDEIIRQFPPEEFMTVAKFIAAQDPDSLDEDFLKGILFDQRT
jgi:uncharacterized FlaG/YvyC family protein